MGGTSHYYRRRAAQTRAAWVYGGVAAGVLVCCLAAFLLAQYERRLPPPTAFTTVGYLPDYRMAAAQPALLGQAYSDIILFSVEPTATGGVSSGRLDAHGYKLVGQLKRAGVERVLVTAGGWDRSRWFAAVVQDAAKRRRFVASLLGFCTRHGFDGVDYDWEVPATEGERTGYDALIAETKQAFAPQRLQVTVAVTCSQQLGPRALAALDRIHLMAYDAPGEHSTYEFATWAVDSWLARGVPARKLCLGVPFYGRNVKHPRYARTYAAMAQRQRLAPSTDRVKDVYFNGVATLQRKAAYCSAKGLAGVMVWEVGQDAPDGTLGRALKCQSPTATDYGRQR